jgi:hypothetical protein
VAVFTIPVSSRTSFPPNSTPSSKDRLVNYKISLLSVLINELAQKDYYPPQILTKSAKKLFPKITVPASLIENGPQNP